jgi:N-terminal domain of anti-restriction factor ArdC/IrrE N-terminal-like domain
VAEKLPWDKLMEQALTAPGSLTGVYDRFHDYSITNMMLFLFQGIHEPVASFSRWKSLGRHVLQGARAKEVIVPLLVKEPAPEDESLEEKRERVARLIGFKVVRAVFALSDTEGREPPPMELPDWDMQTALDKLGIRLEPFESTNGNLQGYSRGVEIAINPLAVHPEKTLMHELGHVVLGHTLPHAFDDYQAHRGMKEFQAEATSYLVLNELGRLDDETAAHSRGYIRHWLQDETPPDAAIRQVFTAADRILRAGRVAVAAAE